MVSLLQAETLKKPHIRLKHRIWSCVTTWIEWEGALLRTRHKAGYGYTPKEAYEDWRRQHA